MLPAEAQEVVAVWRWSASLLHSRLARWWVGDAALPLCCNAGPYLFRPSRLPTPFAAFERYLPQGCYCTGAFGCKFPRGGSRRGGRLEFAPLAVEVRSRRAEE